MPSSLEIVNLAPIDGSESSGLVRLSEGERPSLSIAEEVAVREAEMVEHVDYVFFRRSADGRSAQVAAYVIDNSDERFSEDDLAHIHRDVWVNGSAPLLYVGWPTRVDILSCARGADFWKDGDDDQHNYSYQPVDSVLASNISNDVVTAAQVSEALEKRRRFSAQRLSDGTFWDDPANSKLARVDLGAHQRLIEAVIEADEALNGKERPVLRQLLLLAILIKYLEDRDVFAQAPNWFTQFHDGATSFFEVLGQGTPTELKSLLEQLQIKFEGDVFRLSAEGAQSLTDDDLRRVLSTLIEAKTLRQQRYLWEAFSFKHLPVEVLSHLYQHFAHHDKGAIYTPPFLASLLLDFALPYEKIKGGERILDPTCGSGVFLVGAFRRLVNHWRSRHNWQSPTVATLKEILKNSLFGVELQKESLHLASFSLALAVCDFLVPKVIWNELQFDRLEGTNLLEEDFFDFVERSALSPDSRFDVVLGNPPFLSSLTGAGKRVNEATIQAAKTRAKAARKEAKIAGRVADVARQERGVLPDNQVAYIVAEQAAHLLQEDGRLCLIQPAGLLYNEKPRDFQRYLLAAHQTEYILDFTSVRGLFKQAKKTKEKPELLKKNEAEEKTHTSDTKIVVLVMTKKAPSPHHHIRHLTFRRTFSVEEQISFELDHYDYHRVPQQQALTSALIWKANLLGGGRLHSLAVRLREVGTLKEHIDAQGWKAGEGYIAGKVGDRKSADWLTGKPLLPTEGLTENGIMHESPKGSFVKDEKFKSAYSKERFNSPLMLIRGNEELPCAFWDNGPLAYKDKIVGVYGSKEKKGSLLEFFQQFKNARQSLQAFCLLGSTQSLVGRSTAILKRDIENLPWPKKGKSWDLAFWEQTLCDDLVEHMADYVRLGQKSSLLKDSADDSTLERYTALYCKMLGSIYNNLQVGPSLRLNSLICQTFYFGEQPQLNWLHDEQDLDGPLHQLVYVQSGEALRTTRMVRAYNANVILIVKPDRLRYWIPSTAIRDADETLVDLVNQGY